MPILIRNRSAALDLLAEAPESPLSVKEAGKPLPNLKCGVMHSPPILLGEVTCNASLYVAVALWAERNPGEPVTVVGYCICPGDDFIWRGTAEEFNAMWEGD